MTVTAENTTVAVKTAKSFEMKRVTLAPILIVERTHDDGHVSALGLFGDNQKRFHHAWVEGKDADASTLFADAPAAAWRITSGDVFDAFLFATDYGKRTRDNRVLAGAMFTALVRHGVEVSMCIDAYDKSATHAESVTMHALGSNWVGDGIRVLTN